MNEGEQETNSNTDTSEEAKVDETAKEAARPARKVTVELGDLLRAKTMPDRRGVIELTPEEVGMDRKEFGLGPSDLISFVYQPLAGGAIAEIREAVKDFEGAQQDEEFDMEILIRGLVTPKIPDNADGRKVLKRILAGTRGVIARAIQNQSGYGLHNVKSAKEELSKLSALTRITDSNFA